MAKTKVDKEAGDSTKKDSEKPTKTIQKMPRVAKQTTPIPDMVMAALKKKRDGCTLQFIRSYIVNEFGSRMTKKLQTSIKQYITEEFQQRRIKMKDMDGDEIKFNQQLQIVQ